MSEIKQTYECVCCGGPAVEGTCWFDRDLMGPVCPDCNIKLKWGQARLKEHKIGPATFAHKNRIKHLFND